MNLRRANSRDGANLNKARHRRRKSISVVPHASLNQNNTRALPNPHRHQFHRNVTRYDSTGHSIPPKNNNNVRQVGTNYMYQNVPTGTPVIPSRPSSMSHNVSSGDDNNRRYNNPPLSSSYQDHQEQNNARYQMEYKPPIYSSYRQPAVKPVYPKEHNRHYPNTGANYPNTGVNYPNTGVNYPNTGVNYPKSTVNYPNTGANYPNTGANYPNTGNAYYNPNNGYF